MQWVVTETPDDPSLNPWWVGEARDALHALDQFAEAEGFAPYSALVDPRVDVTSAHEHEGWLGQDEHGEVWAIFTNTTVYALPFDVDGPGIYYGDAADEVPDARSEYEIASADLRLPLTRDDAERIADALDMLASVDEGENTDYDDLRRLESLVRRWLDAERVG
jgi:hypothetical protein